MPSGSSGPVHNPQQAAPERTKAVEPDTQRIILHFDADAFYAQCEELRDPSLRDKPLGVTQKFLIVTCNYVARARNVEKLMSIKDAQRLCPDIVLISGEDLSPYRAASKLVLEVLRRYGPVQKLGLDEVFVDVTKEVETRIAAGQGAVHGIGWRGHVYSSSTELVQDSRHRAQDLRAKNENEASGSNPEEGTNDSISAYYNEVWYTRLMLGSIIAAEARQAVQKEAGIRTSAGIACNRMLAKLVSGLHKPDDQTIIFPVDASNFLAPLPVRAISGIGHKLGAELQALGIQYIADLRTWPRTRLVQQFGDRIGTFLADACWGKDASPVVEQAPSKSITVEDSFRHCQGVAAAAQVISVLAPDLLARLQEEDEENKRRPGRLVLQWRRQGEGWKRHSASCPFPLHALDWDRRCGEERARILSAAACKLLASSQTEPFDLTLINMGGSSFAERSPVSASITSLFGGRPDAAGKANISAQAIAPSSQIITQHPTAGPTDYTLIAKQSTHHRRDYGAGQVPAFLMSKHQERMLREGPLKMAQHSDQADAAQRSLSIDPQQNDEFNGSWTEWNENERDEVEGSLWEDLAGMHQRKGALSGAGRGTVGRGIDTPAASAPRLPSVSGHPVDPLEEGENSRSRVVIHIDIDCFYCAVEKLDDPSLHGVPLAVEQFNSGGFVAVSYEARAAGIRCGDGAGAAGRAVIPHLVNMGARSIEECCRACPGLVVRPMRPERYRDVGKQIQHLLRRFAPGGAVEKASCDDFYLDVTTSANNVAVPASGLETLSNIHVVGGDVDSLGTALRRGVLIAQEAKEALANELGLSASCGVARSKLVARLASPVSKPNGLTVISDSAAAEFIRDIPLRRVPSLQRKFGSEVQTALHVELVRDLLAFSKEDLVQRFGEARGQFLANLPHAIDPTPVKELGAPKTIAAERSFPPATTDRAVQTALEPLVETLLQRASDDYIQHARYPRKIGVLWRQGYAANPRTRSGTVPASVYTWLSGKESSGEPPCKEAVVAAAMALLSAGAIQGGQVWDVTRLAVSFLYGDVSATRDNTQSMDGFLLNNGGHHQGERPVSREMAQPLSPAVQQADTASPAPTRTKASASYRNTEALALQRMFTVGQEGEIVSTFSNSEQEDESVKLALKLQREEAAAAARQGTSRAEQPAAVKRKRQGPLDTFLLKK